MSFDHAFWIVKKLQSAGFVAYFAGGWVRDFVMQHPSNDIDIATSATPEELCSLFPKTLKIGISYGIVIVVIEGHSFEVATFRKDLGYIDGRRPEGIELVDAKEDAKRRDFTINGLFYDPIEKKVLDYVGGLSDIKKGIIRCIGVPAERFSEDRLRMIRAVRYSARFNFPIEHATKEAIREKAPSLFPSVSVERVWQELEKMFAGPHFGKALMTLFDLDLLEQIFPELAGQTASDIKKSTSFIASLGQKVPLIIQLIYLFPNCSLEQALSLTETFKLSKEQKRRVELFFAIQQALKESEKYNWVELHAQPEFSILFYAATRQDQNALERVKDQEEFAEKYASWIARREKKSYLFSAQELIAEGIIQGPFLKKALQEAERLSLAYDSENKPFILAKLKENPSWRDWS